MRSGFMLILNTSSFGILIVYLNIMCSLACVTWVLLHEFSSAMYNILHLTTIFVLCNRQAKKILDSITFKEKNEYRYKVDEQFIYQLKEDLERNRPLTRTGKDENSSRFIPVSRELVVGSVLSHSQEKNENVRTIINRTIKRFQL